MRRWSLRFLIRSDDGEYHAECIDAGAVGIGSTVWEAITDLAASLMLLARATVEEGLQLTCDADEEDDQLFQSLESGNAPPSDVFRWGRMTVGVSSGTAPDVEEVHLAGAA